MPISSFDPTPKMSRKWRSRSVALRDVDFSIEGHRFHFAKGASIHTENSHKYGPRSGRLLLLAGGWSPLAEWTDPAGDFALILAEAQRNRFAP